MTRRTLRVLIFLTLFLMVATMPVFAQTEVTQPAAIQKAGMVIGMGLAAGLCALGQGKAAASAAEAVARNPGARANIQTLMILGLAFIESLAIYTLVVVFAA